MDKLTLINRALGFLGEQSITNPDAPDTPAARTIVGIIDQSRREVLRRYPWNFAECWKSVDKTSAPDFGYADAYVLPADFLRLLIVGYENISATGESDPFISRIDYRLLWQGDPHFRRVIALDNGGEATLKIAYTADITIYAHWDPLAFKVLALWIAMDAAKGITGKTEQVELLDKLLTQELKDAVGVDGSEQAVRHHIMSRVQNARDQAQFGGSFFTPVNYNI